MHVKQRAVAAVLLSAACSRGPAAGAEVTSQDTLEDAADADAGSVDATLTDGWEGWDATEETTDALDAGPEADAPAYRDAFAQPFASSSIWNTPVGSAAVYVPAIIVAVTGDTVHVDEDVIVLTPLAPSTPIYRSTADWKKENRCAFDAGALLYSIPLPDNFVIDTPIARTPNSALAALLSDGRTVHQTQPFARCTAGGPATSDYIAPDVDLYGDGIVGAHGGSGLSAIGGTLRIGEVRPNTPPPAHALKFELWANKNYYNDGVPHDCFRWPATKCDSYWNSPSNPLVYAGTNPAVRPGSLLALPASTSIASLHLTTQPAQLLAWTLQNYGAYLVDDSAFSAVNVCVENGPAGSFQQQFQSDWGFSFDTGGATSPFALDMATIYAALSVIDNNDASHVGGGGIPLQPPALPLAPIGSGG